MNRRLLATLTLAGICAGYYAVIGRHHFGRIAACNLELDAAYLQYEHATEEAARSASLQATVDELEDWQDDLRARLAFDPVADPSLLAVTTALQRAGLTIVHAETLAGDTRLRLPHERVRATVTARFGDLFAALRQLENSAPPTRIVELAARPDADPTRVRAELTIVRTGGVE